MKLALATVFTLLCAAFVSHAEENKIVKVYTLKDGRMVIAMRSMALTAGGKTSYTVTDVDGRHVSFDDSQIEKVEEEAVAQKFVPDNFKPGTAPSTATVFASPLPGNLSPFDPVAPAAGNAPAAAAQQQSTQTAPGTSNVEPYTGPSLGMQPDSQDLHGGIHNGWAYYGPGAYWGWFAGQTYVLDRTGLHTIYGNYYNGQYLGSYYPSAGMGAAGVNTYTGFLGTTGGDGCGHMVRSSMGRTATSRNSQSVFSNPTPSSGVGFVPSSSHQSWFSTPSLSHSSPMTFAPGQSAGHQSAMHSSSSSGAATHSSSAGSHSMDTRR